MLFLNNSIEYCILAKKLLPHLLQSFSQHVPERPRLTFNKS